jgi:hypothetical protein
VGSFSRSAIPSSAKCLCVWQSVESVCLEQGDLGSTNDTSGRAGLPWPPAAAACSSARLSVPDEVGMGPSVDGELTTRPPRITCFQPEPSFSCSGGLAGAVLGASKCVQTPSFRPRYPCTLFAGGAVASFYLCNHGNWQCGHPSSCCFGVTQFPDGCYSPQAAHLGA